MRENSFTVWTPGQRSLLNAAILVLAWCVTAPAQSIIGPPRMTGDGLLFDQAATGSPIRCRIDPVHPKLDYGLRFETGYVIHFPHSQFNGSEQRLSTYLRVTPSGRKPIYLHKAELLRNTGTTSVDGEMTGTFVVGEGTYDVEALLEDEAHRICESRWHIRAKLSGSERELTPSTPANAVEPLVMRSYPGAVAQRNLKPARLTILVHAAPIAPLPPTPRIIGVLPGNWRSATVPAAAKLHDSDVEAITGSLSSLLRQLPLTPVRLVVFNLAQHKLLLQQDDFTLRNMEEVTKTLQSLQLASVDYETLARPEPPIRLLSELLQVEFRDPTPTDALILLGPHLPKQQQNDSENLIPDIPAGFHAPMFYLDYESPARFSFSMTQDEIVERQRAMIGTPDVVETLLGRLNAVITRVRSPHDLAEGIRTIKAEIPKFP